MDIPVRKKLTLLHMLNAIFFTIDTRGEMEIKINSLNLTQFIEWVKNSDPWKSWAAHELEAVNKWLDAYRDDLLERFG